MTRLESALAPRAATRFAEFVSRHQELVRSYIARFVREWADADRLSREVFFQFAVRAGEASEDQRLDGTELQDELLSAARDIIVPYLSERITQWQQEGKAVDALVGRWQIARLEMEDRRCQQMPGQASMRHEQSVETLKWVTRQLAPSSAALLEAHYFQGQTIPQICQATGRNEEAVRQSLLKLRTALLTASAEFVPSV